MDRKDYYKIYNAERRKKIKDVHIYLTNEEYKIFKNIANKENLKVPQVIKSMALSQAGKTFFQPKEKQEKLNEFVYLIRNIANNINQIAKHSNTIKELRNERGLLAFLKDLEDKVKEFIKNDN